MLFTKLWEEEFKGSHFEFFGQKFVKGNSVQIQPHFPAKKLSLYTNKFCFTNFYNNLIEILSTN